MREIKGFLRNYWSLFLGILIGSIIGGTITPNPFNYGSTTAARLLTVQEIKHSGCDTLSSQTSLDTTGALKKCNFLFEGTRYANSSKATYGPLLETPYASHSHDVWDVTGGARNVNWTNTNSNNFGSRPTIDVPKSKLSAN